MELYFAQIIGICAVVFFISSVQMSRKRDLLLYQAIANILYFVQYLLLSAYTAASTNLISAMRCYFFIKYDKAKKKIPKYHIYLYSFLILIFGLANYKGLFTLIPIIITILYIISSYFENTKYIRYVFLICSIIWFFYNFKVKAYVSIIGNVFEFISSIISIIRFDVLKKDSFNK